MKKISKSKLLYITIFSLFGLNLLLKFIGIASNCISMDEPYSIFYAQFDVKDILSELLKGNNPPLWELILHFWIKVFGIGPVSVRFLPMLFSSITVIYVFLIGYRFFNYKVGLTAGLLFTFSNYHMVFAHEARVYPLFCLLGTVSMYCFLLYWRHPSRWKYLVMITLCNVLMCYGHYFGFFLLLVQLLFAIGCIQHKRKIFYGYIISLAAFAIAYLPIINVFSTRFYVSVTQGTWLQPVKSDSWFFVLAAWVNNRVNLLIFLVFILITLILLIYKLLKNYQRNYLLLMISGWFWIPFLLVFFISFKIPMFLDRYLIYMSPAFFLLIPISLQLLAIKGRIQLLLLSFFILLMAVSFKFNINNYRDIDKIALKIKEYRGNTNTSVYFSPPWFDLNLMYYYDIELFKKGKDLNRAMEQEHLYPIYNGEGIRATDVSNHHPVIYIDFNAKFVFPDNTILQILQKNYTTCETYQFLSDFTLYHFYNN